MTRDVRFLTIMCTAVMAVLLQPNAPLADWVDTGVPICIASETQEWPELAPDLAGGAIITWWDWRNWATTCNCMQRENAPLPSRIPS